MTPISRKDALITIKATSGLSEFDREILLSMGPNALTYSDEELCARWFCLFGEIVVINGISIEGLLAQEVEKAKIIALRVITKAKKVSNS